MWRRSMLSPMRLYQPTAGLIADLKRRGCLTVGWFIHLRDLLACLESVHCRIRSELSRGIATHKGR